MNEVPLMPYPNQEKMFEFDINDRQTLDLKHYFKSGIVYYQIEDNDPDGKASFYSKISKYDQTEREYQKVIDFHEKWKTNQKLAPGQYRVLVR